jgi:outer membrane protein TolC
MPKFYQNGYFWCFVGYIPAQAITIPAHFSNDFASFGLLLTLPIYQGGQTVTSVRLSTVRSDLQKYSLVQTRNELIANTVNSYNKLLQLQNLKNASNTTLKALEAQLSNTQLLFDVGRVARVCD